MTDRNDDSAGCAPKRYGLGATPITWQGWAMLAGHIAVILAGAMLLRHSQPARLVWIITFAMLPLPLYAAKTRGGWRWRWGGDR
jgi:hypothetical protein